MRHTPRAQLQLRLVNAVFVLLFLAAVGLLQWLNREYPLHFDWTGTTRYALSAASEAAVTRLEGPLTVTAFASQRGETRRVVRELIDRYQAVKRDIALEFVDPDTSPERVRDAGVQFEGELMLQYGDAKETVPPSGLTEEAFTNALTRLGHRHERWLMFLAGHGERSPEREANFDLSMWSAQLRKRGFKTRTLTLSDTTQIPQNAAALIIAGPRSRLLAGEVKAIERYVDGGGNLLWLTDPGSLHGLEPLAERLGLEFQPGFVVDPRSEAITGSASAIVVTNYPAHAVVKNFNDIVTIFPHAAGISVRAPEEFKATPLAETRDTAWSETGSVQKEVEFNKGKDIGGPLTLGVALVRAQDQREQRVAVFGDGDFLSNSIIGNGGNLELGMSLANWLSQDDAYVSIPVRTAADKTLNLSQPQQIFIVVLFLIVTPLALAGCGLTIWLRRRKR